MSTTPRPKFNARNWIVDVLVIAALWQSCTIQDLKSKVEAADVLARDAYNEAREAKNEAEAAKSEAEELRIDFTYR